MVAAVGIITGAFGAHGLKKRPGMDADKIHSWETAAHYAVCYSFRSIPFFSLYANHIHPSHTILRTHYTLHMHIVLHYSSTY